MSPWWGGKEKERSLGIILGSPSASPAKTTSFSGREVFQTGSYMVCYGHGICAFQHSVL